MKESKNLEVARIILRQLGGNSFIAMTGARNFIGDERSLTFKLPKKGHIKITLNSSDLYDIDFIRIKGLSYAIYKTLQGVFVGDLIEILEEETGLAFYL